MLRSGVAPPHSASRTLPHLIREFDQRPLPRPLQDQPERLLRRERHVVEDTLLVGCGDQEGILLQRGARGDGVSEDLRGDSCVVLAITSVKKGGGRSDKRTALFVSVSR